MKHRDEILVDFQCNHCERYKGRLPICDKCSGMHGSNLKYDNNIMVSK